MIVHQSLLEKKQEKNEIIRVAIILQKSPTDTVLFLIHILTLIFEEIISLRISEQRFRL